MLISTMIDITISLTINLIQIPLILVQYCVIVSLETFSQPPTNYSTIPSHHKTWKTSVFYYHTCCSACNSCIFLFNFLQFGHLAFSAISTEPGIFESPILKCHFADIISNTNTSIHTIIIEIIRRFQSTIWTI